MEVDWSKAPDDASFYAGGLFRKCGATWSFNKKTSRWEWKKSNVPQLHFYNADDYCERLQQWPENDERIDVVGSNGNTGEHYAQVKTAAEFLNACAAVQSERGKQYDASGTGERSFAAAASAFNAATGKSLTGSDVCLLLTMVKLVRQYSSPDRLHHDSLLDGVSYLSLWAEELTKELSK